MTGNNDVPNHRIEAILRRAGVKQSAWGTTLPRIGQPGLREFITSGDYLSKIAYIHSDSPARALEVVYLGVLEAFAKEVVLSRSRVFLCDFAELASLLTRDSEFLADTQQGLRDADTIIVRDLIDVNRTVDRDLMAFATSWLLRCFSSGVSIAIGGNSSLHAAGEHLYTNTLLRLVGGTTQFPVSAAAKP